MGPRRPARLAHTSKERVRLSARIHPSKATDGTAARAHRETTALGVHPTPPRTMGIHPQPKDTTHDPPSCTPCAAHPIREDTRVTVLESPVAKSKWVGGASAPRTGVVRLVTSLHTSLVARLLPYVTSLARGYCWAFTRYYYYQYCMAWIAITDGGGNTVLRNSGGDEGGERGTHTKGLFAKNSIDSCTKAST